MEAPSANRDLIVQVIEKIGSLQSPGPSNTLHKLLTWWVLPFCVSVVIFIRTERICAAISKKVCQDAFQFAMAVAFVVVNLGGTIASYIPTMIFGGYFQSNFKKLIREQFQDEQNIPIRKLLHNTSGSELASMYVSKEMLFLMEFLTMMFWFNWFSSSLAKMTELLCFLRKGDPEKLQEPETPQGHRKSKSVTFNETLETLEYSEANISIKKSQIPKLPKGIVRKIAKGLAIFVAAFCICAFAVPRKLVSNTTMIFYENPDSHVIVTSDHIFLALMSIFLMSNIRNLIKALSHPDISHFPRALSNITFFSWFYNGLIALLLFMMLRLFNDTLMNLAFSIIEEATQTSAFNEGQIHMLTSLLLGYFKHSIDSKCFHQVCSVEEKIDSMVENFAFVNRLFYDCTLMITLVCFMAVPIMIWVVLVEWKLKTYGRNSFVNKA